MQVIVLLFFLYLFLPESFYVISKKFFVLVNSNVDPKQIDLFLREEISKNPNIISAIPAIRWSQFLTSFLFYPFSSLVIGLLYFDLASRQQEMNLDQLAQLSNRMFGTSLSETEESDKDDNEEIIEPAKVEVIDPEQVDENKDK